MLFGACAAPVLNWLSRWGGGGKERERERERERNSALPALSCRFLVAKQLLFCGGVAEAVNWRSPFSIFGFLFHSSCLIWRGRKREKKNVSWERPFRYRQEIKGALGIFMAINLCWLMLHRWLSDGLTTHPYSFSWGSVKHFHSCMLTLFFSASHAHQHKQTHTYIRTHTQDLWNPVSHCSESK